MKTRTPRDPHGMRDEWLTVQEVCTELKISRRTFDRMRATRTAPPCKKVGGGLRIRRTWLEEWLALPDDEETA
jgi:excisionase family DNA binding protein